VEVGAMIRDCATMLAIKVYLEHARVLCSSLACSDSFNTLF
jgi:hypothetical protein